jgi:hypothetical protein
MANPVFPYLPGIGWPIERSPGNFDTTSQIAMSGKRVTYANRTQARNKYKINIATLDSSGLNAGLIAFSKQTLEGFFSQCLGGALIFNWWDVEDFQATAQEFGVGDGATVAFQLARAIGGWVDFIYAPLNQAGPVVVPAFNGGTMNAPNPLPSIYDNGSLVNSSNYSISSAGVVTFNTAPTSGHALTWTGNYYWPCRFDQDVVKLATEMGGIWNCSSVDFTSEIY